MDVRRSLLWDVGSFVQKATRMASMVDRKNIVFLHPDLGIGGAERLVIDAAVGLQTLGHKVIIYTSHCDPGHAFEETQNGESAAPEALV